MTRVYRQASALYIDVVIRKTEFCIAGNIAGEQRYASCKETVYACAFRNTPGRYKVQAGTRFARNS